MTSTPELTTRDVLQQVDRRLSLIEEDLRGLDAKVDTKIGAVEAKLDSKFHLVVGLILASWFSMMGALLLK
ncbi:MAG: hypothetical protein FJY95_12460 [Candidatus Handelsmanbacteria bacterium]|nr:hypothetical protein [Candidatus Handelsmanbacteria bacterium]